MENLKKGELVYSLETKSIYLFLKHKPICSKVLHGNKTILAKNNSLTTIKDYIVNIKDSNDT